MTGQTPSAPPEPEPQTSVRYDGVMITCPVCGGSFDPVGRRRYCSDACRQAAYRRRLDPPPLTPVPARPATVYECDGCGQRLLGQQRCEECGTFMHRIGSGGHCPSCDEPVAIDELTSP